MGERSLGARTARGVIWAYGSYVSGRLLVLLATAVLARLLSPREFGLVALALIFTSVLDRLADLGVSEALIVAPPDRTEDQARTAFGFTVGMGALMAAASWLLAPLAADLFHEPGLRTLLPLLGLNFPLRALGAIHYALAQKRIDFRSRTASELADVVVRGGTGIGLALSGAGAYSLVIGYLAGTLAQVIVLWILVDWRPGRPGSRHDLRDVVAFGSVLSVLDVMTVIVGNTDYFLIGKVLGPVALGVYTLAFRLPELLILNLSTIAGQVLYPAFAMLDRDGTRRAYLVALRSTALVTMPIAGLLVGLAGPVIAVAFGPQWHGAVDPMRVVTLYALAATVGIPAGTAYKAMRRAKILVQLGIPRAILIVGSMALFVHHGVVAVAACNAGVTLLFAMIGVGLATRLLATPIGEILGAIGPAALASSALLGVALLFDVALGPPVLVIALAVPTGLAVWLALMWLLARQQLIDVAERMVPRLGDRLRPAADAPRP